MKFRNVWCLLLLLASFIFVACGGTVMLYVDGGHNEINRIIDENRIIDDDLIELFDWYFDLMQQAENTYFYFHVHPTGIRGFDELPLDGLKSLYHALHEYFNYILIQDHQFDYIGYFSGDEKFINQPPFPIEGVSFRNQRLPIGNNIYTYFTPIRGIQLGQSLVSYFENRIAKGRNFSAEDFYLHDPDDTVNVLLGFNYIGVHELGDIIHLGLYASMAAFNFRVIGFFEYGVSHSHMTAFFETIYFDNAVIMPFFEITYEPTCDVNLRFLRIFMGNRVHGNVRIMETTDNLTSSIHNFIRIFDDYLERVNEVSQLHGLRMDIPLLPIPRQMR